MRIKFPLSKPFHWVQSYSRKHVVADVVAGVTVGVMLIPQGMAYAKLASLPPIHGLYASLVPVLVYGVFGTCRDLAVGPTAIVSLIIGEAVDAEAATLGLGSDAAGTAFRIEAAAAMALLVAIFTWILGVLSAGPLLNFLSNPVLAGFTTGAAAVIASSQFEAMFEVDVPSDTFESKIVDVLTRTGDINWYAVLLTLLATAALLGFKYSAKIVPKMKLVPGVVIVVIIATAVVWGARLDKDSSAGLDIVGPVPAGVDIFAWPLFEWDSLARLALPSALAALLGFLEAATVGKTFSKKFGYQISPDIELGSLSVANLAAAFTSGYPISGALSRSAVNAAAGVQSLLASFVAGGLVLLALLFLTPLFEFLPNAVLAAIILAGIVGLVEIREALRLWRVSKPDFATMMATALATIFLGIGFGLLVGVGLSLAIFMATSSNPHTAILGRVPKTNIYRSIHHQEGLMFYPGIRIWRFDAPLFFGNAPFFLQSIQALAPSSSDTNSSPSPIGLEHFSSTASSTVPTFRSAPSLPATHTDTTATTDTDIATTDTASVITVDSQCSSRRRNRRRNPHHSHSSSYSSIASSSSSSSDPLHSHSSSTSLCEFWGMENDGEQGENVHTIIVDMTAVTSVDVVGLDTVRDLLHWAQECDITLLFANVRDRMHTRLLSAFGSDPNSQTAHIKAIMFPSLTSAIDSLPSALVKETIPASPLSMSSYTAFATTANNDSSSYS